MKERIKVESGGEADEGDEKEERRERVKGRSEKRQMEKESVPLYGLYRSLHAKLSTLIPDAVYIII